MLVLRKASSPLPMLAPTTRPMATGRLISSAPARVAVSSTAARLEYETMANTAPTKASSRMSPVNEANSTFTP
ncbi:hypothetical protein D3C73_1262540 [compost metagenome]